MDHDEALAFLLSDTTPKSPISKLFLSTRADNALRIEYPEIKTVWQLAELTVGELRGTPNIGKKSIAEIEEKLAKCGLHLGHHEKGAYFRGLHDPWYEFSI